EESWRVLAEGRKMLEAGDLEGASKCAYKAENLHGPYSIMELGDRPHKLLDDVNTAEKKRKTTQIATTGTKPPTPAVVSNPTPASPGQPAPGGGHAGARPSSTGPDVGSPFVQAPPTTPAPSVPKSVSAASVAGGAPVPTAAPPANDMMKLKAQALLSDARQM